MHSSQAFLRIFTKSYYTDWINVIVQNFVPRFVPTFISIGIYHYNIFDLLVYFKDHIGITCFTLSPSCCLDDDYAEAIV
jgi:hypothetical protein